MRGVECRIFIAAPFVAGAARVDLDGKEAGEVTARDAEDAATKLAVSFQEVVHSALTEEAEVAEASNSEGRTEWTPIRMRR